MSSKLGRIITLETRIKISNALRNEKHFNWKETPTYGIVHYWLRQNFGLPSQCDKCGKEKKCDWALIKGKKYERNRENFIKLCRRCHFRYDHQEILRTKPRCIDCNVLLKDWYAKRCRSHAQQYRFKNAKNISNLSHN